MKHIAGTLISVSMVTAKECMCMQLTIEVTALQVSIKAYRRHVMMTKEALLHEGKGGLKEKVTIIHQMHHL